MTKGLHIPDNHTPAVPQSQTVKVVKDIVAAGSLQSEPVRLVQGLNAGAIAEQTQEP